MASYYGQPGANPNYQPQGANPNYGWAPQPNAPPPPSAGAAYQSVPAFGGDPNYAENGQPKVDVHFDDRTIRASFVRKVFVLVSLMLGVVTIMCAIPYIHPPMMTFVRQSPGLYYASYATFLAVYLALMCCESVRRSFPSNLICTAILTLAIGYMTMMLTSIYDLQSVVMALTITTVCCASIIVFSSQTKYDLTACVGFLFIASMVLLVFGIVAIIGAAVFHVRFLYSIYAGLAALLFMVYLAVDVQMIMGGRRIELSPEEHIFAAIQIFLDIVYIFWMLLSLFGSSNN